MKNYIALNCSEHHLPLEFNAQGERYSCLSGCSFLVKDHIPRFVPIDNYASSFGLQWNEYRTTQLDSFTGLTISRDRLTRLMGGSLDILKGKKVLEAGCGAGRFTEILLDSGAHMFAVDISTAVEANYKNCHKYPDYFVCQADIRKIPVENAQFDVVVCVGVIQHTPDPEETMTALCRQVNPGGLLVIDHYTYGYPVTLSRRCLRTLLIRLPRNLALNMCKGLTAFLWPLHKILWNFRSLPFVRQIRHIFLRLSPLVDYYDAYPQLGAKLLKVWATLDTHDTITDFYKHLRSAEEIKGHLEKCGMTSIETLYAGNGVEVRARKAVYGEEPSESLNREAAGDVC